MKPPSPPTPAAQRRSPPWRPALGVVALLTGAAPVWAQPATPPAAAAATVPAAAAPGVAAPAVATPPPPRATLPADAPGPVGGVPSQFPALNPADLKLPSAEQLRQALPRPVLAAGAALGWGRQRLALVLGMGTVGTSPVLDSAARDSLAVATALRAAGFVVMVREDVTRTELRAALQDFSERLQPSGIGLLYATGLGAQVDGRNLLLPRDAALDPAAAAPAVAEHLRQQALPVQDLVDALAGSGQATGTLGTRLLVVDAAYQHPALNKLPQPGLLAQPLPAGVMALFAQPPQVAQARPAAAPLPTPRPTDAQLLAATPFARLLVKAVLTPKLSGAEVLRSTQRSVADSTQGAVLPWLAGDTDAREDMAELTLLDAVLPRTPEEVTREAAQRAMAQMAKGDAARLGEAPVSDVLQQAPAQTPASTAAAPEAARSTGTAQAPPEGNRPSVPEVPGGSSALGTAASVAGTAVGVASTVAGVAATAATAAVGVKAAQASAAVSVASTAVGAASAVTSNVAGLAQRLGSSGAGEASVRQAAAAASATPAAAVPPAVPAAPALASVPAAPPGAAAVAVQGAANAAAPATPAFTAAPATATRSNATNAARALAATAGEMSVTELLNEKPPAAGPAGNGAQPTTTDGRTVRHSGGGERPAYNPRTNSHGHAEGDTYTYRVTDTWKDEVTGRYTTAIEEVLDDGQLLANSQQVALDAQGRLKMLRGADGSLQQFEPCQDLWWSKPTAGQRRDISFKETFRRADQTQGQTQYTGSSTVGRLRKVETPAGTFDALPIETSGWTEEVLANGTRTVGQFERTVWYSPQLGQPVAIDIKDTDRLGKLLRRERVELMHAQQVRNPP